VTKFCIEIEIDNDAFKPSPFPELARLMEKVRYRLMRLEPTPYRIVDANGNTIGRAWHE